jgi:hypothetical protein
MHRSSSLLLAAVVASSIWSGCSQPPVEHTVRRVTTEDVRRDTETAVDTAAQAAIQAKEDFESRLKSGLADMDAEIAKLQEKAIDLKDDARTRWNDRFADLKAKRETARRNLDELGKSTGEAWDRLEKGAQSAWDDLQKAFEAASKEF